MIDKAMKSKKIYQMTITLVFVICGIRDTNAQDFTLFEPVDASATANQPRPGAEARAAAAKPEFTLLGSSRFGDDVSIILAHRDGRRIVVKTAVGNTKAVPEYLDYQVTMDPAGKVSLTMPAGSSCIDFPESGVHCEGSGEVAVLGLANRPAVASTQQTAVVGETETAGSTSVEVSEDPANPFAAMRARAPNRDNGDQANGADRERGGRFSPRRIDPSEVPPGMRVVSTPFGDRLVPQ